MKNTKRTTKSLPTCNCGCGNSTKGGRFLPGHDAKLKKALVDQALEGSKRAANKLEALGWSKFLTAKLERAGSRGSRGVKPQPTEEPKEPRTRVGRRAEVTEEGDAETLA